MSLVDQIQLAMTRIGQEVKVRLKASNNLQDVANRQSALNYLTGAASAGGEHVLTKDAVSGNVMFKAAAGGGAASSISNAPAGNISSTNVQDALNELDSEKAASSHTHGNITTDGKIGTTANVPVITGTGGVLQAGTFGTGANTFCQGNDSRLSDARTPTDSSVTYGKVAAALKQKGSVSSTIDLSANGIGEITLSANTAFTFTGFQLNKTYLLKIVANGYTPSWAVAAKHVAVEGNATFATTGTFYVSLTCIDATSGSEKLLTLIMKGV